MGQMLSLALCGALLLGQSSQEATTPPPWDEKAVYVQAGPPARIGFVPGAGALPYTIASAHGPSFGVWVNLDTLNLYYLPDFDLQPYSTTGVTAHFKRCFRSDLAIKGEHSPGLPPGWIHNFDVYIPYPEGETWQPLALKWGNGASQVLEPETENGVPTGKLFTLPGCPFAATGEPGEKVNEWKSIRLNWAGGGFWGFWPHRAGCFVLREIGNADLNASHTKLLYTADRQLGQMRTYADDQLFVDFEYNEDGYISSVKDRFGKHVDFVYGPATDEAEAPTQLLGCTGIADAGGSEPVRVKYGYHIGKSGPLLTSVSIPSPADNGKTWATSQIFYKGTLVKKFRDATGNEKMFKPGS